MIFAAIAGCSLSHSRVPKAEANRRDGLENRPEFPWILTPDRGARFAPGSARMLLAAATMYAVSRPARRAASVDPVTASRAD
jgi:hypothetical protein